MHRYFDAYQNEPDLTQPKADLLKDLAVSFKTVCYEQLLRLEVSGSFWKFPDCSTVIWSDCMWTWL